MSSCVLVIANRGSDNLRQPTKKKRNKVTQKTTNKQSENIANPSYWIRAYMFLFCPLCSRLSNQFGKHRLHGFTAHIWNNNTINLKRTKIPCHTSFNVTYSGHLNNSLCDHRQYVYAVFFFTQFKFFFFLPTI